MLKGLGSLGRTRASWGDEYEREALTLLSLALLPQRFSMEGISNILQSGIRQTFGPSGSDKQVRPVSLLRFLPRLLPLGLFSRVGDGDALDLSRHGGRLGGWEDVLTISSIRRRSRMCLFKGKWFF